MVDPIQRTSSVPVPAVQTAQAVQDPLPVGSSREQERAGKDIREDDREDATAAFEEYLNDTAILTLDKSRQGQPVDAAAEIEAGSVYSQPGHKTPV